VALLMQVVGPRRITRPTVKAIATIENAPAHFEEIQHEEIGSSSDGEPAGFVGFRRCGSRS
jgi:hypothetical protein